MKKKLRIYKVVIGFKGVRKAYLTPKKVKELKTIRKKIGELLQQENKIFGYDLE